MLPRLHVGLTVWPARSDFFFALRRWVSLRPIREEYQSLSLPPDLLDVVLKVEYSSRWALRFIYYRNVVRFLETEIARIMRQAAGQYEEVIFYTPDDGYWAELLNTIRDRVGGKMRILNLQHGHASTVRPSKTFRRLFNRLCLRFFGYPNFGYGFGAGSLDGYIVMSEREASYIQKHFGTVAYTMPEFLRGDFLVDRKEPVPSTGSARFRVLFAISPIFGRKSNLFGGRQKAENAFMQDIADMLRAVKAAASCDVVFRFHPGTDIETATAQFLAVGLDKVATIDPNHDILESLQESDFVVAYNSTVLLEAALLGKVPVNFIPKAYPPRHPLGIDSEIIYLQRAADGTASVFSSRGALDNLFGTAVMARYQPVPMEMDYAARLPWL